MRENRIGEKGAVVVLCPVRIVSGETVDLPEDELQHVFEKDLTKIEEGLEFVDSEVHIGTGRIDTLALDEKNRPVFIEYKKQGEFDRDALIQLMDYLSWFVQDETHIAHLERHIRKKKNDLETLNPEIRLICVVNDVEDRVKNACYVISNPVEIVTYTAVKDERGEVIIVPRISLDNTERVKIIEGRSEEEILKESATLAPIYNELKKHIQSLGDVDFYMTSGETARFRGKRVFAEMWFGRKWVSLSVMVGKGKVDSPRFKYWRSGDSDWGYLHITGKEGLDDELKTWIKLAYTKGS